MDVKKGRLYIGTSNVILPGNKSTFPEVYQSASRLKYYSSIFNSVEINSSFYKLPLPATFKKWASEVSPDFLFSVKLSKSITHSKELSFDATIMEQFMIASNELGAQRGSILIQFPGKAGLDHFGKLDEMLGRISDYNEGGNWDVAVEFRNKEWYVRETTELLQTYHASIVLHDMPLSKFEDVTESAAFVYLRFHGKGGDYRGTYNNTDLKNYAQKIAAWLQVGKTVYAYFNNSIGDAYNNALTLKNYLPEYATSGQ